MPEDRPLAQLEGWRQVEANNRRTALDDAQILKDLADVSFPEVDKIVLVQDDLNTHKLASLDEAFLPAEARRLVGRFEWHFTPKHGRWLNMAECELAVLASRCLERRVADKATLAAEAAAWNADRDARIKLRRL